MDVRHVFAQSNRFSAAVRKLLSIKGEEHDISYGVHLEEERPEYSFIKGERRWIQYNEVTSAAGTLSIVGVLNPIGSGVLGVVTVAWANVTANAEVRLTVVVNTGIFGSTGPMHSLDTRYGLTNNSTMVGTASAAAAAGGSYIATASQLVANVDFDFMTNAGARVPPIILAPGAGCWLNVAAVGVNTLKATFAGYERSLESGELIPGS